MGVVVRFSKPPGERRIEFLTWGALLIWIGVMVVVEEEPGVTGVGVGGIMLLSAVVQRVRRYQAGLLLWGFGLYFLLDGLDTLIDIDVSEALVAGVLIALGVLFVARACGGRGPRATISPD